MCILGEQNDKFKYFDYNFSDEASLVYMAYHCVGNSTYKNAEDAAFNFILQAKNENGTFGNEYSTALAVQVSN